MAGGSPRAAVLLLSRAMGLTDLFRPKHRHSNVQVRTAAVRELTETDVLADVARRDREASVRKVAVERIDDVRVLADLASELDGDVAELARTRAGKLRVQAAIGAVSADRAHDLLADLGPLELRAVVTRAKSEDVRTAALERIDDPKALADLAKEATETQWRRLIVDRIDDVATLRTLVLGGKPKDAAAAALDRIHDPDLLEQLTKKAPSKNLRNRAKKRLAEVAPPVDDAPAREAADDATAKKEQTRLVEALESRVRRGDFGDAEAVAAVLDAWARIPREDETLSARLQAARTAFDEGHAAWQLQRQAEAAARAERIAQRAKVLAAERAAAVDEPVTTPEPPPVATPEDDPEREARRAEAAAAKARREEAKAKREADEADKAERARQSLVAACEEVEALAEVASDDDKQMRAVDQLLRRTDRMFANPPRLPTKAERDELTARYRAAVEPLRAKVAEWAEQEKWREWSHLTHQTELVDKAKKLQAAMAETEDVADKLKALQDEWKKFRAVPGGKGQELWQEFKTACDAIYEVVKAQHAENLAHKDKLVARAESLMASTDWAATAAAFKDLQAVWKTIGPVGRVNDQKVYRRFRAAADHFFAKRKEAQASIHADQDKNLAKKTAIITRLEALATTIVDEDSWRRATTEAKALQRSFRDIGHVPRTAVEQVRDRMQQAADAVFGKLERLESEANVARKAQRQAEAAEIEGLLGGAAQDPTRIVEAWGRALRLEDTGVVQACRTAAETALQADPAVFAGTDLDPDKSRRRKAKLCERVESLRPEADDGRSVVERLQAAMAGSAIAGETAESDLARRLADARGAWTRVGPTPDDEGRRLDARFAAACAAIEASVKSSG